MKIQENVSLKEYTTFKIGGPAKFFCVVKNENDLIEAFNFSKKNKVPVFVLGGGSNILVADEGYQGLVIKQLLEFIILKMVNILKVNCNILSIII